MPSQVVVEGDADSGAFTRLWRLFSPEKKPDIIVTDYDRSGAHLFIDISWTGFSQRAQHAGHAASTPLSAARAREQAKRWDYRHLRQPHRFVPFVIERYGALGQSAQELLEELTRIRGHRLRQEQWTATWTCPTFRSYWRQRIAAGFHHTVGLSFPTRALLHSQDLVGRSRRPASGYDTGR